MMALAESIIRDIPGRRYVMTWATQRRFRRRSPPWSARNSTPVRCPSTPLRSSGRG